MSDQVVSAEGQAEGVETPVEVSEELGQEDLDLLASEDGEQAVDSADAAPATQDKKEVQDEVNKEIQKWILKGVKGEDVEITDINDLVKRAQKGLGADLKFQEAADIKKEAAELLRALSDDPLGLLEELGLDTLDLSKKRLAKQVEEEAKSPEQKQREVELKELQEARSKLKEIEDQKRQMEYDNLVASEERKIEEGMLGALESEGIPAKPAYIKRMAEVMQAGLDQGVELTPKEALAFARREVVSDLRELLDVAPDDMLEDLIGSNNAKRMRKRYLAKAKEKTTITPSRIPDSGSSSEPRSSKPKGTLRDWMRGKVTLE